MTLIAPPSLKNMTMNQCASRCWLGRPGKGSVTPHSRGLIDNICCGEGSGIAFIFRPGGLNRTIHSVAIAETIKRRMTGFGLKRPGDGVAPSFF